MNQKPKPIAITTVEASALARVGRTLLYKNIRSGSLPARKLGNRTLIFRTDPSTKGHVAHPSTKQGVSIR